MAFNVTIVYNGPIVDNDVRVGTNIPRYFEPANSYVDLPVMTEGFENADQLGDKGTYGKSIYATNVEGQGFLPGLLPMNSAASKYAWFEQAIFAAKEAEKAGTANAGVTFTIETSDEQIYWLQQARGLEDQGFVVTVAEAEDEAEPGNP